MARSDLIAEDDRQNKVLNSIAIPGGPIKPVPSFTTSDSKFMKFVVLLQHIIARMQSFKFLLRTPKLSSVIYSENQARVAKYLQ